MREQPTGELSFGVGYSTAEDLTTQFSVSERNFLGRGQKLRLNVGLSNQVQRFNVGFTEPYFLNRDVSAGFSIFDTQTEYEYQAGLETSETGFGVSLGFPLSEDGRLSLFANFVQDELINNTNSASINASYRDFKQTLGYYYSIDKRDDVIDPTDGWNITFGQDIAGPAGDVSFLRTTATANYFHEIAEGWIFHAKGTMGVIHDYKGGAINYNDRFFRGGRNFRGFERGGIGPRDLRTGYALGSNRYLIGTTQVALPLGIPKEVGMRANAFIDFGVLGETDAVGSANSQIQDEMAFRATYGLSVAWRSPFGPVRFDFARPIVKEDYDETRFSDLPSEPASEGNKVINNILHSALVFAAASFMAVSTVMMTGVKAADGPVVLVFDVDRAIALSKAGKSMAKQLEEQVKSVRAEEKKIVDDLSGELEKLKEQQKLLAGGSAR